VESEKRKLETAKLDFGDPIPKLIDVCHSVSMAKLQKRRREKVERIKLETENL